MLYAPARVKPSGRLLESALLSILAVSLSGCGGGVSTASTPSPPAAATSQPPATSEPIKLLSAVLSPQNGGTVQATLTVAVRAAGYTLQVEGHSLHPGGTYPVKTIGGGPCGTPFLPPIQAVGDLIGDEYGNGQVEKSYPRPYVGGGIIGIGDYIAQVGEFERKLVACADLPAA